jgi:hypothetical protein
MFRNEPNAAQMVALNQPVSKAAYDYWNALRNGRPLPRRRDVDPAQMRAVLPHIMLIERLRTEEFIFRLAGTSVCQAFGRELRDHSLLSLWDVAHRGVISVALSGSLKNASPLLLRFRGHAIGRRPLPGELMLLPLLDGSGQASRLLASLAFARDPLGPKAFTRLELLRAETVAPSRDRVELTLTAPPAPRPILSLVPARTPSAIRPLSGMSRPWAGLFRDFLCSEEG